LNFSKGQSGFFPINMFKGRRSSGPRGPRSNFGQRRNSFPQRNRFTVKTLNPLMFVRRATPDMEVQEVVMDHKFSDFNMHEKLLANLKDKGIVEPTPIQDKALEHTLAGSDVLGLADTGTGKTITFALPIVNKLLAHPNENALIMAPTRELAVQIRDEIRELSKNLPIYSCLLIGGSDIRRQIQELRRRPHIFIGTPGRLRDLFDKRMLHLDNTHSVVLDEVDRMLDMGFVKEITELLSFLPKERQTLLFSATMDVKIEQIAMRFMKDPIKISVKSGATSNNIDQDIVRVSGKQSKMATLASILSQNMSAKVLIFGRTKFGVEELSISLQKNGFNAEAIHGNKRQNQREMVLRKFKSNQINILCATDVAARGIDVKDITHVINFDQPATYEDYVHRIGRTGRAGKKGIALTFVD